MYKGYSSDYYESHKRYKSKNREKYLEWRREYDRVYSKTEKRRENCRIRRQNPQIQIINNHRHKIRRALTGVVRRFSSDSLGIIGLSIEQLKQYLEQRAPQGFTWEKYENDEYQVDHITAACKFNLQCSYHRRLCFHYTNLQLLATEENLRKGVKT